MGTQLSDQQHFIGLIKQNEGIIWKIIHLYVDDEATKEDLRQEVLLQAWRSFPRFEGKSSFSTWLYRVALNTVLAFNRKKKPIMHSQEHASRLSANHDDRDGDSEMLWLAIKSLDDIDKTIITLHLDGYANEEIAEILGITRNHVGVKLHRIKTLLSKKLKR